VPEEEKSRRLGLLQEAQRAIQMEGLRKLANTVLEVHVDGKSKKEDQWYGHSSCNRVVNFSSARPGLLGQYLPVRVSGCTPNSLLGEHLL